ncbi:helix-turn-helix domain-containing protein [Paenibacillus pinistramenti]|uniref:helix-turn-helix domain-containing protein n=1 Tax=Paenibacillus pinistramenti TaxID=1768003 RepID=UPI001EF07553|nr:AraC family transcriptional regulator [Paenibacillus pinistramenti]
MSAAQTMGIREVMMPDVESTFRVFAAHLRTVEAAWTYPLHSHPLFEINLLLDGRQCIKVNGQEHTQQPGDLVILRPGDLHESLNSGTGDMTYYCIHFDSDERELRELLCRGSRRLFPADSLLTGTVRPSLNRLMELAAENEAETGGGPLKLHAKMNTLSAVFGLFAALTEGLTHPEAARSADLRSSRVAEEIAAFLERAVEQTALEQADALFEEGALKETVASAMSGLGYSPSACTRMFQEVYGLSPRRYLSRLKLKKAKLLLMQPELSIEQISSKLGYADIAHFSRQFKRWTGESPGRFRARVHI